MSNVGRSVNRRDLFTGWRSRGASARAGKLVDPPGTKLGHDALLKASRPGMGSFFEVKLPAQVPGCTALASAMLDRIDRLERQLTVYQADSEVSRLNAGAHLEPMVVERGLFELLERAVEIGLETEGAYDVTMGALSAAWGFTRGPKRVPGSDELMEAKARSGQEHLILDKERLTVAFDRPGVVINLGSIGKGFAIDRAVELARDYWWPTPAIVHGGQSSAYALGSPPGRFAGRWEITLANPFLPESPLGILKLRNQALGTSGAWYQAFESGGRQYGHILDPRTGEPAEAGPLSVTVVAGDAALADALSTAFTLLGIDKTARYIDRHPEVGAIFVLAGQTEASPRLEVIGLDAVEFAPGASYEVRWRERSGQATTG